ncbi:MAG: hypothetical protein KJ747_01550 [Actinobacteria bacterium]|nr:hypothetical protein [Actinomycetota bacterium]MCG2808031.1 hypothetical protein [Coriobacteriia bacterium]
MPDVNDRQELEAVVRGIASAGKALKLYPPTSPIPRQSVDSATAALSAFLGTHPVLSLSVARQGFGWCGQELGIGMVGVSDLADALRDHGVAEVDFLPGASATDLMSFLDMVSKDPKTVREAGGFAALLSAAGIESVRAVDVALTVLDLSALPEDGVDDAFLQELATDAEKLAAWMAAATAGDPRVFGEGLIEIANSAGADGMARMLEALATAFMRQTSDSRDVLLGLSFSEGPLREITGGMFGNLADTQLAESLADGLFGANMLSLSNALTGLPLESRLAEVKAQVQAMLKDGGHADKELTFLEHMVEVRRQPDPEIALIDTEPLYRKVALASAIPAEEVARLRAETTGARSAADRAGVSTMLALLDQQKDFDLYCRGLNGLAAMVPRLIQDGEIDIAQRVLNELTTREARAIQPWPELTDQLRAAITTAVSQQAMAALLRAVTSDPTTLTAAREIARVAGDAAGPAIIAEAITNQGEGLKAAEDILGRRVIDLLAAQLPHAQWFQIAPVVARLVSETDPRAQQAIMATAQRTDEQSRREVAAGLAQGTSPWSARLLAEMTSDSSTEVAIAAVRALGKATVPGAAGHLALRLEKLDVDNKDFLLCREMIEALARTTDPDADRVLERLAGRKTIIKRGHFAEVQDLARQAVSARLSRGGVR